MKNCLKSLFNNNSFSHIIVGFSGGPDSTALLLLLKTHQVEFGYTVEAIHFQHNLRGKESIEDEEWCYSFCRQQQIKFTAVSLDLTSNKKHNKNIESRARELRIQHLIDHHSKCDYPHATAVALGHTADDKIENLIIRLFRGSNVTGLTSLKPISTLKALTIIRPLLHCSKQEILTYLDSQGITNYRHDYTNSQNIYTRNIVRNKILPSIFQTPQLTRKSILQSLTVLSEDAEYIEAEAKKAYSRCQEADGSLSRKPFSMLHSALQVRVLRYWLNDRVNQALLPNRRLITRLQTELASTHEKTIAIPIGGAFNDTYINISSTNLIIKNEQQPVLLTPIHWKWQEIEEIIWHQTTIKATISVIHPPDIKESGEGKVYLPLASFVDSELLIRSWQPGDRMIPFSHHSSIKLKKIFNSAKVINKNTVPIICTLSGEIIWIPFIRRSASYALSPDKNEKVLILSASNTQACN